MFYRMGTDLHPRRQGDLGEAAAIAWLTKLGAGVSLPLFHSPDYDVVAEIDGAIVKRKDFAATKIKPGQSIELIRLVGGG